MGIGDSGAGPAEANLVFNWFLIGFASRLGSTRRPVRLRFHPAIQIQSRLTSRKGPPIQGSCWRLRKRTEVQHHTGPRTISVPLRWSNEVDPTSSWEVSVEAAVVKNTSKRNRLSHYKAPNVFMPR